MFYWLHMFPIHSQVKPATNGKHSRLKEKATVKMGVCLNAAFMFHPMKTSLQYARANHQSNDASSISSFITLSQSGNL